MVTDQTTLELAYTESEALGVDFDIADFCERKGMQPKDYFQFFNDFNAYKLTIHQYEVKIIFETKQDLETFEADMRILFDAEATERDAPYRVRSIAVTKRRRK